jgi:hypothetical protein
MLAGGGGGEARLGATREKATPRKKAFLSINPESFDFFFYYFSLLLQP